jgi:hypothetical protein
MRLKTSFHVLIHYADCRIMPRPTAGSADLQIVGGVHGFGVGIITGSPGRRGQGLGAGIGPA